MAPHDAALTSHTGRIRLVPASEANDEAVAKLRMHPETRRYLRSFPEHVSTEDARKLRESRLADPTVLPFHVYVNEEFAGTTTIFHINEQHHSCEVGIILSPDVHGGGVATDVLYTLLSYIFEERKMHRVTFETGSDNLPMRGWLEKVAGARMESQRLECRQDPVSEGYSDMTGYAILEWEWTGRVKERLERKLGI